MNSLPSRSLSLGLALCLIYQPAAFAESSTVPSAFERSHTELPLASPLFHEQAVVAPLINFLVLAPRQAKSLVFRWAKPIAVGVVALGATTAISRPGSDVTVVRNVVLVALSLAIAKMSIGNGWPWQTESAGISIRPSMPKATDDGTIVWARANGSESNGGAELSYKKQFNEWKLKVIDALKQSTPGIEAIKLSSHANARQFIAAISALDLEVTRSLRTNLPLDSFTSLRRLQVSLELLILSHDIQVDEVFTTISIETQERYRSTLQDVFASWINSVANPTAIASAQDSSDLEWAIEQKAMVMDRRKRFDLWLRRLEEAENRQQNNADDRQARKIRAALLNVTFDQLSDPVLWEKFETSTTREMMTLERLILIHGSGRIILRRQSARLDYLRQQILSRYAQEDRRRDRFNKRLGQIVLQIENGASRHGAWGWESRLKELENEVQGLEPEGRTLDLMEMIRNEMRNQRAEGPHAPPPPNRSPAPEPMIEKPLPTSKPQPQPQPLPDLLKRAYASNDVLVERLLRRIGSLPAGEAEGELNNSVFNLIRSASMNPNNGSISIPQAFALAETYLPTIKNEVHGSSYFTDVENDLFRKSQKAPSQIWALGDLWNDLNEWWRLSIDQRQEMIDGVLRRDRSRQEATETLENLATAWRNHVEEVLDLVQQWATLQILEALTVAQTDEEQKEFLDLVSLEIKTVYGHLSRMGLSVGDETENIRRALHDAQQMKALFEGTSVSVFDITPELVAERRAEVQRQTNENHRKLERLRSLVIERALAHKKPDIAKAATTAGLQELSDFSDQLTGLDHEVRRRAEEVERKRTRTLGDRNRQVEDARKRWAHGTRQVRDLDFLKWSGVDLYGNGIASALDQAPEGNAVIFGAAGVQTILPLLLKSPKIKKVFILDDLDPETIETLVSLSTKIEVVRDDLSRVNPLLAEHLHRRIVDQRNGTEETSLLAIANAVAHQLSQAGSWVGTPLPSEVENASLVIHSDLAPSSSPAFIPKLVKQFISQELTAQGYTHPFPWTNDAYVKAINDFSRQVRRAQEGAVLAAVRRDGVVHLTRLLGDQDADHRAQRLDLYLRCRDLRGWIKNPKAERSMPLSELRQHPFRSAWFGPVETEVPERFTAMDHASTLFALRALEGKPVLTQSLILRRPPAAEKEPLNVRPRPLRLSEAEVRRWSAVLTGAALVCGLMITAAGGVVLWQRSRERPSNPNPRVTFQTNNKLPLQKISAGNPQLLSKWGNFIGPEYQRLVLALNQNKSPYQNIVDDIDVRIVTSDPHLVDGVNNRGSMGYFSFNVTVPNLNNPQNTPRYIQGQSAIFGVNADFFGPVLKDIPNLQEKIDALRRTDPQEAEHQAELLKARHTLFKAEILAQAIQNAALRENPDGFKELNQWIVAAQMALKNDPAGMQTTTLLRQMITRMMDLREDPQREEGKFLLAEGCTPALLKELRAQVSPTTPNFDHAWDAIIDLTSHVHDSSDDFRFELLKMLLPAADPKTKDWIETPRTDGYKDVMVEFARREVASGHTTIDGHGRLTPSAQLTRELRRVWPAMARYHTRSQNLFSVPKRSALLGQAA